MVGMEREGRGMYGEKGGKSYIDGGLESKGCDQKGRKETLKRRQKYQIDLLT